MQRALGIDAGGEVLELAVGVDELRSVRSGSVDAVVVASSFDWRSRDVALAEIRRVLRPAGALALVGERLDRSTSWVAELDDLLGAAASIDWLAVLSAWGVDAGTEQLRGEREVDEDALVHAAPVAAEAEIRSFVAGFPALIRVPSLTDVFWCRKRS